MTSHQQRAIVSLFAMATALAACGGGGGAPPAGGAAAAIVPVLPPPPQPPPPPVGTAVFGTLGQTTSQFFTTLGFGYRGVEVGGFGDMAIEPASVDAASAIDLRLTAPAQLSFGLSGLGEGTLAPNGGGGSDDRGRTTQLSYHVLSGQITLSLVRLATGDYLTSSATGYWSGPPSGGARAVYRIAQFAYGVPTPANQVPSGGMAAFDSQIYGSIALAAPGEDTLAYYVGTARMSVNFGTQSVSGTIEIRPDTGGDASDTYTLTQTMLTSDRTGFQGRLVSGAGGTDGFIEGRFTGPSAREMIVRWRAPVRIGSRSGLMFGVWAAPNS